MSHFHRSRADLFAALRRNGVADARVLAAMEATPREIFLSPKSANIAYADEALPIECGQTISQPFIVAYMTGKLDLSEDMRVLEIGTGSGYQTAILSRLAAHVFSVEIHAALAEAAAQRLARLHITNVTIACGDGRKGWP